MKDRHLGMIGTNERDEYEYELRMELLGRMIKMTRQERDLKQQELGDLVGVQKSQISKLENGSNSATIDTLIRVFKALNADINFNVRLKNQYVKLVKKGQ
jgi:HTH-type transcriptional regulator / antitoxin HipB